MSIHRPRFFRRRSIHGNRVVPSSSKNVVRKTDPPGVRIDPAPFNLNDGPPDWESSPDTFPKVVDSQNGRLDGWRFRIRWNPLRRLQGEELTDEQARRLGFKRFPMHDNVLYLTNVDFPEKQKIGKALKHAGEQNKMVSVEYSLELDGRRRWYSLWLNPLGKEECDLVCEAVAVDITRIKRVSQIITNSQSARGQMIRETQRGLLTLDQGIIIHCNEYICNMLGVNSVDLLGSTVEEWFPRKQWTGSHSRSAFRSHCVRARKRPQLFDWQWQDRLGQMAPSRVRVARTHGDPHGSFMLIIRQTSITRGVTRSIRNVYGTVRPFLERHPGVLWVINDRYEYLAVSEQYAKFFECKPSDIVGASVLDYCLSDDPEEERRLSRVAMESKQTVNYLLNVVDSQGVRHKVEISKNPVIDDLGRVIGLTATAHNIGEQSRFDKGLEHSASVERALLNAFQAEAFLIDRGGCVLATNQFVAMQKQKQPEELVGASIWDWFAPDMAPRVRTALDESASSRIRRRISTVENGRQYLVVIIPIFESENRVERFAVFRESVVGGNDHQSIRAMQALYEDAVSTASKSLLNGEGTPGSALREALQSLMGIVNADRAFIGMNFRDKQGRLCIRRTHEVCLGDAPPLAEDPRFATVTYDKAYGRWATPLGNGRCVSRVVSTLLEGEMGVYREMGIHAFILIPMNAGGEWIGFIGLESVHTFQKWRLVQGLQLSAAGNMFGGFLQRIHAGRALRASENHARALLDASSDEAFLLSETGVIRDANRQASESLGLSHQELVGKPWHMLYEPELAATLRGLCLDAIESGDPVEKERRVGERWILFRFFPLAEYDSSSQRLAVFASDVTEKVRSRRVEDARRRTDQTLLQVSRILLDEDADEDVHNVMRLALLPLLTGARADRVHFGLCCESKADGVRIHTEVAVDDVPRLSDVLEDPKWLPLPKPACELMSQGLPFRFNQHCRKSDTSVLRQMHDARAFMAIPIMCRGRWHGLVGLDIVRDGDPWLPEETDSLRTIGSLFGAFLERRETAEEQTAYKKRLETLNAQLKAARDQALASSRAKSTFLTNITHELRTPLNSIIGFTRVVLRSAAEKLPERERQNLERVMKSASHLLELINELLEFSRVESGRLEFRPEPIQLRNLLQETVDEVQPLMEVQGNRAWFEMPDSDLLIYTDRGKLRQILLNLLNNAAKFTANGDVDLKVEALSASNAESEANGIWLGPVRIRVRDTGIGMTEEQQRHVFDAFWQAAQKDPGGKGGGFGLGLSICARLCRLLNAELALQSRPGEGTSFTLLLPPPSTVERGLVEHGADSGSR